MNSTTHTSTEERALALLGAGVQAEQVASALGVSPSRISQLVSDPQFANQIADLRFKNLSEQNEIDSRYRDMESRLQSKLESTLDYMYKPGEILAALRTINGTHRRGVSAPEQVAAQRESVTLNMPVQVIQQFVTNVHNQVIKAGDQELVTVQSSRMKELLKESSIQQNPHPLVGTKAPIHV